MKKKVRKMTLHKETLLHLQPGNLLRAEGGAEQTFSCRTVCCDTTNYTQTCPTWCV